MQRSVCLSVCLSVLILSPTSALAKSPFEGFYLGGQLGVGKFSMDTEYTGMGYSGDDDGSTSDLVGGVYFGGGKPVTEVVYLGGEVDFMVHNQEIDYSQGYDTVELAWSIGGKARLGGIIADRHLIYGLLGLRIAHFKSEIYGYTDSDETRAGISVGAGYEFAITHNIIARAEGAYTGYAPIEFEYVGGPYGGMKEEIDPTTFTTTVGLAWRF